MYDQGIAAGMATGMMGGPAARMWIFRSCLKFFLRTFETGFRADFCRFLRRIAALFYDKNGGNMPEWCHKELLKKF